MLAFLRPTARESLLRAQSALLRIQLVTVMRILRALLGSEAIPLTNEERATIASAASSMGWAHAADDALISALGTVRGWFQNVVQRRKVTPKNHHPETWSTAHGWLDRALHLHYRPALLHLGVRQNPRHAVHERWSHLEVHGCQHPETQRHSHRAANHFSSNIKFTGRANANIAALASA